MDTTDIMVIIRKDGGSGQHTFDQVRSIELTSCKKYEKKPHEFTDQFIAGDVFPPLSKNDSIRMHTLISLYLCYLFLFIFSFNWFFYVSLSAKLIFAKLSLLKTLQLLCFFFKQKIIL